jgi:hypothetical protein
MKNLSFGAMQAVYYLESKYVIDSEDNYCSVFNSKLQVNALYEREKGRYRFFVDRSNVFLDTKPVRKKTDMIIHEVGNSLYPLYLDVSPFLRIMNVSNFEEVKIRRQNRINSLLSENPSDDLEQYIRLSGKNLSDRKSFINSLYQDVFFNLYFRNIFTPTNDDEVRLMQWRNFPQPGMNQSYLYTVKSMEDKKVHLTGEVMRVNPDGNGTFDIEYKLGNEGEIRRIDGEIETFWERKSYIKRLSLKAETVKTGKPFLESVIVDD